MKSFLVLFWLLFYVVGYGQWNIVQYKVLPFSPGGTLVQNGFLAFNEESSYYLQTSAKKFPEYDSLIQFSKTTTFAPSGYMTMLYHRFGEHTFYGTDWLSVAPLYADSPPKIKWRVTEKTARILGFDCRLAIGDFRGRKYEAWFTTEIPKGIGPWKFEGLPGLILKVQDSDHLFSFEAFRIKLNDKTTLPQGVVAFLDSHEKNAIPYKAYIELMDHKKMDLAKRAMASTTGVFQTDKGVLRSGDLERVFEWEIDTSSLNKKPEKH